MATEVKVRIEDVVSGRAQQELRDKIGDALAQTALFQMLQRAWYRRHGKETVANSWRGVLGELIGVMFIVLFGCGAVTASNFFTDEPVSKLTFIAGSFGYIVYVMVASLLKISGGQLNPAITIAMMVTRNIGPLKGFIYIISQVAGSIVGATILYFVTPPAFRIPLGANRLNPATDTGIGNGLGIEFFLTYLFALTAFATAFGKHVWGNKAWIAVGFAIYLGNFVAGPFTGASLNPARSFGPLVLTGFDSNQWIFWVACPAGAVLAGVTWGLLEYGRNAHMKKQKYTFDLEEEKRTVGCYVRLHDTVKPAVWVGAVSEFLAVFMLVFWGRGTLIATLALNPVLTPSHVVAVSIARGMAYAVAIYSFMYFSGAHVNAAVTIVLFFTKHVGFFRALVYVLSQVVGGIFGAGMLWVVIPQDFQANLGFPVLGTGVSLAEAWGWEAIFSGLLVFCYYAMLLEPYRRGHGRMGPLGVGFAVITINFVGIAYTGCGLNPSEILGLAVVTNQVGNWSYVWIYVVGPISGALVVGILYTLIFLHRPDDELTKVERKRAGLEPVLKDDAGNLLETAEGEYIPSPRPVSSGQSPRAAQTPKKQDEQQQSSEKKDEASNE